MRRPTPSRAAVSVSRSTSVRRAEGRLRHGSTIDENRTERRQAEHWAAELFDSFATPVTIYEPVRDDAGEIVDFRRIYANSRTAELLCRPLSDVRGTTLRGTGLPQFFDSNLAIFCRVLRTGTPETMPDVELTDPSTGRPLTLEVSVSRVADRVAQMSRDVTLERTAEREVTAARVEAERANLAKSEFLSRMSHELRTPLNAILGFSQVLEQDELSDDQRECVAYIRKGGRHLLDLINEVLDISRIESGQMTISAEPVELAEVINEAVALVRPLAESRGIHLRASEGSSASYVLADRQRLKQILLNLLSNAIKYNREHGSVQVRCAPDGAERVCIEVADTGYGVASDQLDRLFRPFERLGAEWGAVEGTGIGLALSKGLAEAMGGSISVESVVGVGTTFSITLGRADEPLARYERTSPAGEEEGAHATSQTVVLHIEDNVSNLRLVERVLARRAGVRLLTAMQGSLGIDLAREHRPDLVLLDLHLPDMPGQDVLRLLRSHPDTRDIPVVVLSADATKSQIALLMAAGAAGYLTKPLDVGEFLRQVDRAIDPNDAAAP